MLIGGVIDDEVYNHAQAELPRLVHEFHEVSERARARVHTVKVRDIVPVVAIWRRIEGHQPDARHAETRKVVEPVGQPDEIANAVAARVEKRLNVQAIDDALLVPEIANHIPELSNPRSNRQLTTGYGQPTTGLTPINIGI